MPNTFPPKGVPPIQALGYVGELLLDIVVPTVLCAWGGRWLDQRFGTSPLATIVGLVLALVLVAIIIRKKAEEMRELFYPKSS